MKIYVVIVPWDYQRATAEVFTDLDEATPCGQWWVSPDGGTTANDFREVVKVREVL